MRPSSLASCMRRMRFLAAITVGVLEGPSPPQRRLLTRPSLGLPCLAYDSGSARQIRSGMVQVMFLVDLGKVDVSLPAVGRSTLQSPRLPKALGSTS